MLYEAYKDNRVYSGQLKISFPKRDPNTDRVGEGTEILMMCPTRNKATEALCDESFAFKACNVKYFTTDSIYREKIGKKRVIKLERGKTDAYYMQTVDLPLKYLSITNRRTYIEKKRSLVNDISMWMELTFARIDSLPVRRKCEEFLRILKARINDPTFAEYQKILVFDLKSWNQNIKSCVVMNRKLLNNPLSILFYTACYLPDLLEGFPDVRLMIVNRDSNQIYFCPISFITKKNYPKIKGKLNGFKDLIFSAEDDQSPTESTTSEVDNEVKSEVINAFKEDMKTQLRYNLLGSSKSENPFDKIEDITSQVADPFDELDKEIASDLPNEGEELSSEPEDTEDELEELEEESEIPDDQLGDVNITDEIHNAVDDALSEVDDIDAINPDELVKKISNEIREKKYRTSFMPERDEKELAKIERLTKDQELVLDLPALEDTQRKVLTTATTGGYIKTSNPAITTSKFVSFDKDYTEKCLPKNIDSAVAALSRASDKIFVTSKEITDSSDVQNLKELHTYHMVDEKGNRMTIAFDVPKIIDGSYVYLNGTKKLIKHQLILRPIVKSGTNIVQIVTSYNKVFIYRHGVENQNSNRIRVYIDKHRDEMRARAGNCSMLNAEYEVPLDYAMLSKYYLSFEVGKHTFYLSIDSLKQAYKRAKKEDLVYDEAHEIPIALNTKTKEPVMLKLGYSYTDALMSYFSEEEQKIIAKIKRKPKSVVANAKILKKFIPLVIFMMYCEGFASVMKKSNIKYEFIDKKTMKTYDPMKWDFIELSDGIIAWDKSNTRNELLMNGFKKVDMSDFSYEDLESKDTFISIVSSFYPGNNKINFAFDNYRDFLLDEKTQEILSDFGYPTDLVSLMVVAAGMLTDTKFMIENNLNNMRVRSAEVIADLVYTKVTAAYSKYRNTAYKKKPSPISLKKSVIIDALLDSDTNMIEEASSLNPVLEAEKQRSVTFKGLRGIQMNRAMTLPRRCYDKTMTGTIAVTTSTDSNVGVNRSLTLEPAITSTYGYIDAAKSKDLDSLKSSNLLSITELLQPMGCLHDDPDRTSMSIKHTKQMVPVKEASPVLFGNKVEATLPYLVSDEFVVTAKQDGKVVEISDGYCVVKYKDGTNYAIDISNRAQRNASAGFWIDNTLKCDLKVGQKFVEGEVLAYNDKHFSKNRDDRGVSMNLGVLCKVAISSQWDVFEDSSPISRNLSEKLTSEMVDEKDVTFSPYTHIDYIAKVGDHVNAGDPLIIFSESTDENMQRMLNKMREDMKETVLETSKTSISSKFTGEIIDVKIYTTSELEDLDPSLREIVEDYWNRIRRRNDVLNKNGNPGDLNYYKAGQIINEVAEVVTLDYDKKLMGHELEQGDVLILFYIKYQVAASKGDKIVCSVCKGIVSHVFEEGLEPYSEYRPEEVIDNIVAPLAVSARKIPNIFLTIFTNKLIIELKRQLKDIYME